jgi:hypothetical protein
MKLFGKLLITVLIIGVMLPFTILKGRDGKPLMSFSDLKLPSFSTPEMPKLPGAITNTDSASGNGNNVIYKWTDAEGNLQFSTSPPPEGIEYTAKGYDPDVNVIQSVEIPLEAEEKIEPADADKEVTSKDGIGNVYSPESIEKLFKDAKNVEKLLNDRLKNQNAQIGD